MRPVHVLVLEDERHCRERLQQGLDALENCTVSVQAVETLADFRSAAIDWRRVTLCLVDLVLPDGCGIEAIGHARARPAPPTVLVVSSLADEHTVLRAIEAGASGYVCKTDSLDEIRRGLAIAIDGGACMSPTIAARVMTLLRRNESQAEVPVVALTPREREVLLLSSKGFSYRQIAEMTQTRPSTVYTHVRHIYEKLHVCNLQQALFEARTRRLV